MGTRRNQVCSPKQHLIIIHDPAGRGEDFECWTDVDITRLVESEVLAREGVAPVS
jgi:hypothetical protein